MDIIFKDSRWRITQEFGNNPEYYGQWGLKGHEGIDLVPDNEEGEWTIYSPAEGFIRQTVDSDSGVYGKRVLLAVPSQGLIVFFCHMSRVAAKPGHWVQKGTPLGRMGNTGNSFGAHLHLMLYRGVYDNGWWPNRRDNYGNGYKGMLNPLPRLSRWKRNSG